MFSPLKVYKASLCFLFFLASSSFAEPKPAEEISEQELVSLSIEELSNLSIIKVTARKREEKAQDVPMSLSVLSGDYLNNIRAGAPYVGFIGMRTPSLLHDTSFGRTFPRFHLRGLSNSDFDLNASQPVSLVYDEVVLENPAIKSMPVFDMRQIEVLRGPQGSLFGRNAPAGVIKFKPVTPSSEESAEARLSYGTGNTFDFEGAAGGSLLDRVSFRISLLQQQRNSFVDNLAPGFEQSDVLGGFNDTAGRIQFLIEPDKDLSALIRYHFRDQENDSIYFRGNVITPEDNTLISGFEFNEVFQDSANRAFEEVETHGGLVKVEYSFDSALFRSVSAFETARLSARGDIDGGFGATFLPTGSGPGEIPFPVETADKLSNHIQLTQEFNLSSRINRPFGYQVGLFFFHEDITIDSFSFDTLADGTLNGNAQQEQETNALAIFGTLTFQLSDSLELHSGARFSHDKKSFSAERTIDPLGTTQLSNLDASPSDSHLSFDLSLLRELNENHRVYFRFAESFRAPSIQGRVLFGDEITIADSEKVYSFELGTKSQLFESRGWLNSSVYYFFMDDQQITAVGGDSNFNQLVNVDRTIGYGVELDSGLSIANNWSVMASASYNYTEIEDPGLGVRTCVSCTVTDPLSANGLALIDGNPLPHAAEWIANIALSWKKPLWTGELFAYTDWAYRSSVNFFLYESVEFTGPELYEGGLRLGYRWGSKNEPQYSISIFSRNILNENHLLGGVDFNNLTGIVGEGRFIGAEMSVSM